jgi:hypothetical protein
LTLVLTTLSSKTFAWSNKEHIQLTRLAAERLIAGAATPPDMKDWLRKALPHALDGAGERDYFLYKRIGIVPRDADGLLIWATMPDMLSLTEPPDKKVQPFGVHARLLHFIDCEYFMPRDDQRTYAHDLSHKPRLADFPDDMSDWRYQRAGMLPFAVRECYQKMVDSIRSGRLDDAPGRFPRDEHATKWAGMLAHYLEDNTQPQHATIDFKSASYFANKHEAPNVHAQLEYRMCDDEDNDFASLRAEYWPLFIDALETGKDPVQTVDPWISTIEVSLVSYDALPLIGEAAMAATKQAGTPQQPVGPAGPFDTQAFFHFKGRYLDRDMTVMEMKARQSAWAVHRVERLWLAAWAQARAPAE